MENSEDKRVLFGNLNNLKMAAKIKHSIELTLTKIKEISQKIEHKHSIELENEVLKMPQEAE